MFILWFKLTVPLRNSEWKEGSMPFCCSLFSFLPRVNLSPFPGVEFQGPFYFRGGWCKHVLPPCGRWDAKEGLRAVYSLGLIPLHPSLLLYQIFKSHFWLKPSIFVQRRLANWKREDILFSFLPTYKPIKNNNKVVFYQLLLPYCLSFYSGNQLFGLEF